MTESNVIRNAVCLFNEVAVLLSQSGKFQTIFSRAASSMYDTVVRLRPSSVSYKVDCESQGDQECTAAVRICVAGPGRNVEIQGRICSKSRRDVTKIPARKYIPSSSLRSWHHRVTGNAECQSAIMTKNYERYAISCQSRCRCTGQQTIGRACKSVVWWRNCSCFKVWSGRTEASSRASTANTFHWASSCVSGARREGIFQEWIIQIDRHGFSQTSWCRGTRCSQCSWRTRSVSYFW